MLCVFSMESVAFMGSFDIVQGNVTHYECAYLKGGDLICLCSAGKFNNEALVNRDLVSQPSQAFCGKFLRKLY